MRLLSLILLLSYTALLSAQTIDQKMGKLADKGYLQKDFIPQIKQIIMLKEDTVIEASVLNYLYNGNLNFNSDGILKEHLTNIKNDTKYNPQKVLRDMVACGMIEKDSSIRWLKQQIKNDSAQWVKTKDIYYYLKLAGEYEDVVKPYRLKPLLAALDSLQLLSKGWHDSILTLSESKQLNNLGEVFVRCNSIKSINPQQPKDIDAGVKQLVLDAASLVPEITISDVMVRLKEVSDGNDSIFITLVSGGKGYHYEIAVPRGIDMWRQIGTKGIHIIINKVLAGNGVVKRIRELSLDTEVGGASKFKALCALTGEQYSKLQMLEKANSNIIQMFHISAF